MTAAATFLLAALLAAAGTYYAIPWLKARALVAHENERTMHSGAVPQGGGLAVMAAVIVAAGLFGGAEVSETVLLATAAALAAISLVNDRREIPSVVRLAAHLTAAAIAVAVIGEGWALVAVQSLVVLEGLLLIVGLAWFINAMNFMDGIDGITGVEAIAIATGSILVAHSAGEPFAYEAIAAAVAGGAFGFLVWNWHKARVFLGDVGSIPLGFLLGAGLIVLARDVSVTSALILPLYYLVDATGTLIRRFRRGEKVAEPHRTHAYQRAARAIGRHDTVAVAIAICNAALVGAAVLAVTRPVMGFVLAVIAVGVLMVWLEWTAAQPPPPPSG